MVADFFSDLNWVAVLVAAIAWFAFSSIWYSVPPVEQSMGGQRPCRRHR